MTIIRSHSTENMRRVHSFKTPDKQMFAETDLTNQALTPIQSEKQKIIAVDRCKRTAPNVELQHASNEYTGPITSNYNAVYK